MSWLPKKSVVVPIDFSDDMNSAIDTALDLVDSASDVHVIHVLTEMSPQDPGVIWDSISDTSRKDHVLEALKLKLPEEKYQDIGRDVLFGDAGHQVADYAQSVKADLIVLPSHGRTGLKRILLGSVAERIVRLSHCPVLVLRK